MNNETNPQPDVESSSASNEPSTAETSATTPVATPEQTNAANGGAVDNTEGDLASANGVRAPDAHTIKQIVEAALLAAGQPLSMAQLGELFLEDAMPGRDAIARALHALADDCEGRGVELLEVASGFRYQVRAAMKPWVSRLWAERQTRYSRALLETLALIAYRQPITRGEIEQIRGVAVSSNIIRTLEEREWVRVIGHRDVPGKPALFGTTKGFLDYFSLKSLDQLPPLSELRDIPELEPQFDFDDRGEVGNDSAAEIDRDGDGDNGQMGDDPEIVAELSEAADSDREPAARDDIDDDTAQTAGEQHPDDQVGDPVDDDQQPHHVATDEVADSSEQDPEQQRSRSEQTHD